MHKNEQIHICFAASTGMNHKAFLIVHQGFMTKQMVLVYAEADDDLSNSLWYLVQAFVCLCHQKGKPVRTPCPGALIT